MVLFSARSLIVRNISVKFHINISNSFQVTEFTIYHIQRAVTPKVVTAQL